jgi:hypothetical protein
MEKTVNKKSMQIIAMVVMAIIVTVVSVIFPAAFTFGGYSGIGYHGFPAGWTGEMAHGIASLPSTYASLQYANYILGFVVDIVFWFFAAFILFALTQMKGGRR